VQNLSEGARVIVHVLQNVGPAHGGSLPLDHFRVLFPGEERLLRGSVTELTVRGFITSLPGGNLMLTRAGGALTYLSGIPA
jgi:hypothetical protein